MKIPFNLERCIAGDEVVGGNGTDYVFGACNPKMEFPLIGWLNGLVRTHFANGVSTNCAGEDLFMKPKKITRWIVVSNGAGFDTKEKAVEFYGTNAIRRAEAELSIVKIEFYPGEGFE